MSAVVAIKRHPANSRRVALPHLQTTSPGYPASFASFAFCLDCPTLTPTTSVEQKAKVSPHPPQLPVAFSHKQNSHLIVSSLDGKDNSPPSVIFIVHQHQQRKRRSMPKSCRRLLQ